MSGAIDPQPVAAAPASQPLSRQVSRAMLWNAVLQPARLLAGLASGLVLGNLLTREEYGIIAILGAMASTLGLIADFGIERGLIKFLPEIEARYGRAGVRRVLWIVNAQKFVILGLLVVLGLLFRDRFFAYWRGSITEPPLLADFDRYRWLFFGALLALLVLGAVFDVYMQALLAYFRQRAWNGINIVLTLLKPLLLAAVVLLGWGVFGVVGAMVAVPAVATALAAWQTARLRSALVERPAQAAAGARVPSRFVKYSMLSYWVQVTEYFYSLEFVLLVLPGGAAVAGGFKFAHSLVGQLLTALWSPLVGVQIPLFARIHARGDDRQLGDAYAVLSKFLAVLMIPAAVGLGLLVGNLIALVGPQFAAYGIVGAILAVTLCLDAAIGVPRSILLAYERHRPILVVRTLSLLTLPLLLVVAPRYGAVGAAVVMGGARVVTGWLAMVIALRTLPLRYPWAFAGRVLLASAVMAAVVAPPALLALAPTPDIGRTDRALYLVANLGLAAVGALVFLAAFRRTGGLDAEDRRRLRELKLPVPGFLLRWL